MNEKLYQKWQEQLIARRWYRFTYRVLGIYSVVALFGIGLYFILSGQWRIDVLCLAALFLGRIVISGIIYLVIKKSRPYQRYKFTTQYSWLFSGPTIRLNSFPSDHAISFAAVGAVVYEYYPYAGIFIFVLAALNGWARIYLGYHDAWDIMFGWIFGVLSGAVVVLLLAPLLFTR